MVSETLVGRWSGAAALGDALGIAAGASLTAWLSTRLSLRPGVVTAVVCVIAAVSTVLQLVVDRPELLVVLRVVVGLSYGGAVVLMRTALGQAAEPARRGVTFGVAQSAFAGGFAFGALGGSAVIGGFGLVAAFLLSAGAFGLVAIWSLFAFAATARPATTVP